MAVLRFLAVALVCPAFASYSPQAAPQEALTAEQLFRKFEKQVQDAKFAFIAFAGERTVKKGQETTRSLYTGTYHAKGGADGGSQDTSVLNQDASVRHFGRGGKITADTKEPGFAKVSDYFWHGPVTRSGFFAEVLAGPCLLMLPPVSDFKLTDPKTAADAAGSKVITYTMRPGGKTYTVTLSLDEKSLIPRERVIRWSADGEEGEIRERYHAFSMKEIPALYREADKALPVMVASGRLSAKVGEDRIPAGWIREGVSYRAEGQTRLLLPSGGRATLAAASECSFKKLRRGHEIQLTRGQVSVEFPFENLEPVTLVLGQVRLSNEREVAGRSVLTATPDRVVVEKGAASVEGVPVEPSSKVTINREVHHLLPEGVEYWLHDGKLQAQKERTLPPATRSKEKVVFRLDLTKPDALRGKLLTGNLIERDGRPVLAGAVTERTKQIVYDPGKEDLFDVKPATYLRFRYFLPKVLPKGGSLELWAANRTKDKEQQWPLFHPQSGQWTTFTLPVLYVWGSYGAETSHRFGRVRWEVYAPDGELFIDGFEVVEIEP